MECANIPQNTQYSRMEYLCENPYIAHGSRWSNMTSIVNLQTSRMSGEQCFKCITINRQKWTVSWSQHKNGLNNYALNCLEKQTGEELNFVTHVLSISIFHWFYLPKYWVIWFQYSSVLLNRIVSTRIICSICHLATATNILIIIRKEGLNSTNSWKLNLEAKKLSTVGIITIGRQVK